MRYETGRVRAILQQEDDGAWYVCAGLFPSGTFPKNLDVPEHCLAWRSWYRDTEAEAREILEAALGQDDLSAWPWNMGGGE